MAPNILVSGGQQDTYLFSQRLVWNRLNAGDLCFYATLSHAREDVFRDMISRGWDISPFIRTGVFRIVDYLSLADASPRTLEERLDILFSISIEAVTPEKLYAIFVREFLDLRSKRPDQRFFAILDSVDKLVDGLGLENTLHLAEMCVKTLQGTNSLGVALLCTEFLSEETLEVVKSVASVVIELRREWRGEDVYRMARVAKPQVVESGTDWIRWYY